MIVQYETLGELAKYTRREKRQSRRGMRKFGRGKKLVSFAHVYVFSVEGAKKNDRKFATVGRINLFSTEQTWPHIISAIRSEVEKQQKNNEEIKCRIN